MRALAGEVLLTVPNKNPVDGSFRFSRITEQLRDPGEYVLQFELTPALPGRPPISLSTRIVVCPGEPMTFEIKVNANKCQQMSTNDNNPPCRDADKALHLQWS